MVFLPGVSGVKAKFGCIFYVILAAIWSPSLTLGSSEPDQLLPLSQIFESSLNPLSLVLEKSELLEFNQAHRSELEEALTAVMLYPHEKGNYDKLDGLQEEMKRRGLSPSSIQWLLSTTNALINRRIRTLIFEMLANPSAASADAAKGTEAYRFLHKKIFLAKDAQGKTLKDYYDLLEQANVKLNFDQQQWDLSQIRWQSGDIFALKRALGLWVSPDAFDLISGDSLSANARGHLTFMGDRVFVPKPTQTGAIEFEIISNPGFLERLERDPKYPGKELRVALKNLNEAIVQERNLLRFENVKRFALPHHDDLTKEFQRAIDLFGETFHFLKNQYNLSEKAQKHFKTVQSAMIDQMKKTIEVNTTVLKNKKKALYEFIIFKLPILPFNFAFMGLESAIFTMGSVAYNIHKNGQGLKFNQDLFETILMGWSAGFATKLNLTASLGLKGMSTAFSEIELFPLILHFLKDFKVISRAYSGYYYGTELYKNVSEKKSLDPKELMPNRPDLLLPVVFAVEFQ